MSKMKIRRFGNQGKGISNAHYRACSSSVTKPTQLSSPCISPINNHHPFPLFRCQFRRTPGPPVMRMRAVSAGPHSVRRDSLSARGRSWPGPGRRTRASDVGRGPAPVVCEPWPGKGVSLPVLVEFGAGGWSRPADGGQSRCLSLCVW